MMRTLLLYGGGIDSSTLLVYLANGLRHASTTDSLSAVFFRYGQKAEELEHEACAYFCKEYNVDLHVVDVPFSMLTKSTIMSGASIADDPKTNIVDGRNCTFVSLAGMLAARIGANKLAMGYHIEPVARPFPDASIEFVHAINKMIPYAYVHKFEVIAPFADYTREEIFRYADHIDPEILKHAHTCYENVRGGCGICSHCLTKKELMEKL